jgi:membrane protease YdiL (CAAX protease family)
VENSSTSPASPASPAPFPADAFNAGPTLLAFIGMLAIAAVILFAGTAVFMATHGLDVVALQRAAMGPFGIELQAALEATILIYLALVVPAIAKRSLAGLGFQTPSASQLGVALIGAVVMVVVVTMLGSLLAALLHVKTEEAAIRVFLSLHGPAKIGFAAFAVVLAPIVEEFVFRVFFFNAMRAWWGLAAGAIVSSALFGFAHAQGGGPAAIAALVIPLTLGGLVLTWVYARTRNAWMSMVTHGLFNGVSIVALFFAPHLAH